MSKAAPAEPVLHATEHDPGGSDEIASNVAWPIGSVFIAVVSTDPADLLGFGTWAAFGAGRVLVSRDAGDADFDTAEETGGAKTVQSSAPSVDAHTMTTKGATGAQACVSGPASHTVTPGAATSVVQPYIVVYMWKRTA